MAKITINIDTDGDEPKVTTTTENTNAVIPNIAPPKEVSPEEQSKEVNTKKESLRH